MSDRPVITVVVPTFRRAHRLPALVEALEQQTLPQRFEVVVVDNGSPDDTSEVLEELSRCSSVALRPLRIANNTGPVAARNLGWRSATADLVAFTDDDCSPDPGWLEALLRRFESADVVQGRTVPHPQQQKQRGPFSRTVNMTSERGFYETCNIAYRRSLLEHLGGFDEEFHFGGEDTDLGWRAKGVGARTAFERDALVHHDVSPSDFRAYVQALAQWQGMVRVARRHPQIRALFRRGPFWRPSHLPAFIGALGIVLLLVSTVIRSRPLTAMAVVAFAPYARFRLLTRTLHGGKKQRIAAIPLAFVADLIELWWHAVSSVRVRLGR